MLKLFGGSKIKNAEKAYKRKLEEAQQAQRGGDMPRFAELSAEAEELGQRLDELRAAG